MINGIRYTVQSKDKKTCFYQTNYLRGVVGLNDTADDKPSFTLTQWLNEWLNTFKRPNIADSTYINYSVVIRNHIPINLQGKFITELTPLDVQNILSDVTTSRTRLETYNVLNASLNKAVQLEFLPKNPCDVIEKPRHKRIVGTALTKLELANFLKDIRNTELENYYLFLLYTGARRNEALSVTWDDVNFSKRTVHLNGTKNETSDRTIPLMSYLVPIVKRIEVTSSLLFNFSSEYVTKKFHKLVPNHKLHDLRHTFATLCLENSIPLKVVQTWLGHSSIKVTASTYTHVQTDFSRQQAKLFSLNPPTESDDE